MELYESIDMPVDLIETGPHLIPQVIQFGM